MAEVADLGGQLPNGDGMLLVGHTHMVQKSLNQIAVIELAPTSSSGEIDNTLTESNFQVPTTIARHGNSLYAVNSRFRVTPAPLVEYSLEKVDR